MTDEQNPMSDLVARSLLERIDAMLSAATPEWASATEFLTAGRAYRDFIAAAPALLAEASQAIRESVPRTAFDKLFDELMPLAENEKERAERAEQDSYETHFLLAEANHRARELRVIVRETRERAERAEARGVELEGEYLRVRSLDIIDEDDGMLHNGEPTVPVYRRVETQNETTQ